MSYHDGDNFNTYAKILIAKKLTIFGQKMVLANELGRALSV